MPWRHMGEWRDCSSIFDLGTTQRWVVGQLHAPAALPRGEIAPRTHWIGDTGVPQSQSGCFQVDKNLSPLPRIEPRPSSPQPITMPTQLSCLLIICNSSESCHLPYANHCIPFTWMLGCQLLAPFTWKNYVWVRWAPNFCHGTRSWH
jgi:hypothetical protein